MPHGSEEQQFEAKLAKAWNAVKESAPTPEEAFRLGFEMGETIGHDEMIQELLDCGCSEVDETDLWAPEVDDGA